MDETVIYQNLLNNLKSILNEIRSAISNLDDAYESSKNGIKVDELCYKKSAIQENLSTLRTYRNTIRDVYIPAVKEKISEVGS